MKDVEENEIEEEQIIEIVNEKNENENANKKKNENNINEFNILNEEIKKKIKNKHLKLK